MAIIKNTRDFGLQSRTANSRIMNPSIAITTSSSPVGYSYFNKPANSTTVVPDSITLTASTTGAGNYPTPVYSWEYSTSADPVTWISLGVTTAALVISNEDFVTYAGTGNFVNFRITVSQVGWSTLKQILVVEYYRAASVTPIVSLSRGDLILPISTSGTINYAGTGTNVRVSINNVYIPYYNNPTYTLNSNTAASILRIATDEDPLDPGDQALRDILITTDPSSYKYGDFNQSGGNPSLQDAIVVNNQIVGLAITETETIRIAALISQILYSPNLNIILQYNYLSKPPSNTFTVTAVGSTTPNNVTAGASSTTTTLVTNDTRTFGDVSGVNATVDPGSIVYTITVRDADGTVSVFTRTQSVIVSLTGANAKTLRLTSDSSVFKADANNSLVSSTIKLTANKQNTTGTVSWVLVPSIDLYSAATGGSEVTTGDIVYLRSTDFGSNTSTLITASTDGLSDTCSILRVRDGSASLTAILSNPLAPLSTTAAGDVTYTGSGTTLQVYEGSTLRTITAVSSAAVNITAGVVSSGLNTTTVTIGDHSFILQDNASIVYTATFTRGDGSSDTVKVTQSFTKSKTGIAGDKSITISAFRWSNLVDPPAFTGTGTFTWLSKTYDNPPSNWTSAAGAAPGTGYTLYQVNLTVSAVSTAETTNINWADGSRGVIGYRQDGSIGLTGDSHRTAYIVTTSSSIPGNVTADSGNYPPVSGLNGNTVITDWSFAAPTTNLAAGQYMYQVDGIYTNGGSITWGNPYLSNLKVGSLSALAADLGSVSISSTGSLASKDPVTPFTATKTYGSSQAGFFLGYDSTTYKFDVGNATNYMRWDGTNIVASGITIKDTSGNIILASGSSLQSQIAGGNIIPNSDLSAGIVNWILGLNPNGGTNYQAPVWDLAGTTWAPAGGHNIGIYRSGSTGTAGSILDIRMAKNIAVIPEQRYEASAYLASHRCDAILLIVFMNTAGTQIGGTGFSRGATSTASDNGGQNLANWQRVGGFFTVPSECTQIYVSIRALAVYAGQVDPYVWATRLFMAQAAANQTSLSAWSASGSSGAFSELDQITTTNGSTYIAALDAGLITAGYMSADRINAGTLSAVTLDANTVTINGSYVVTASGIRGVVNGLQQSTTLMTYNPATVRSFPINMFHSGAITTPLSPSGGVRTIYTGYVDVTVFSDDYLVQWICYSGIFDDEIDLVGIDPQGPRGLIQPVKQMLHPWGGGYYSPAATFRLPLDTWTVDSNDYLYLTSRFVLYNSAKQPTSQGTTAHLLVYVSLTQVNFNI